MTTAFPPGFPGAPFPERTRPQASGSRRCASPPGVANVLPEPYPKNERPLNVGENNAVMRKLTIAFVVLSSLLPSFALANVRGTPPPFPRLRGPWSHAQINVVISHKPHTLILDRGRITHIAPTRLTLYEVDRSIVIVKLTQQTLVEIDGAPARIDAIKTGMYARTMRIDGGAAVRIAAKRPHPPKPSGGRRSL